MAFQTCPNCGSEDFIEYAKEATCQGGVKIEEDGSVNYHDAGENKIMGCDVTILGYTCEECNSDFIVKNGKLVFDPEGEQNEQEGGV